MIYGRGSRECCATSTRPARPICSAGAQISSRSTPRREFQALPGAIAPAAGSSLSISRSSLTRRRLGTSRPARLLCEHPLRPRSNHASRGVPSIDNERAARAPQPPGPHASEASASSRRRPSRRPLNRFSRPLTRPPTRDLPARETIANLSRGNGAGLSALHPTNGRGKTELGMRISSIASPLPSATIPAARPAPSLGVSCTKAQPRRARCVHFRAQ